MDKVLMAVERIFLIGFVCLLVFFRFFFYPELSGNQFFEETSWLYLPLIVSISVYKVLERVLGEERSCDYCENCDICNRG